MMDAYKPRASISIKLQKKKDAFVTVERKLSLTVLGFNEN